MFELLLQRYFYRGNGSGKSTILNVIAKKLNFGKKERKKHKQPHGCVCKPVSALNGFRLDDRRI